MRTKYDFVSNLNSSIEQWADGAYNLLLRINNDNDINAFENDVPILINNVRDCHKERQLKMKAFDKDIEKTYNIYQDLSVKNKFIEIDHSNILKKMLDTENAIVGNPEHIKILINLINRSENKINKIKNFSNDYMVEREKGIKNHQELGRIDLFLCEKKQNGKCIIIENKITGKAVDQDNQLARYYEVAKRLEKEVAAIVYLPFYKCRPPIDGYYGEYEKDIEEIKEKLVVIPVWEPVSKNDLIHGFLEKCANYSKEENKNTAAVCIEQYAEFLKSTVRRKEMAKNTDRKFLEKLLVNSETRKTVEDIVEIWENKNNTLKEILIERLKKECCFGDTDDGSVKKPLNDNFFVYFGLFEDCFQIGFGIEKGKFPTSKSDELKKILNSTDFSCCIYDIDSDSKYVYGWYRDEKLLGTYDSMFNDLLGIIKNMEKQAGKLLGKNAK
jgi:hypothetical protein